VAQIEEFRDLKRIYAAPFWVFHCSHRSVATAQADEKSEVHYVYVIVYLTAIIFHRSTTPTRALQEKGFGRNKIHLHCTRFGRNDPLLACGSIWNCTVRAPQKVQPSDAKPRGAYECLRLSRCCTLASFSNKPMKVLYNYAVCKYHLSAGNKREILLYCTHTYAFMICIGLNYFFLAMFWKFLKVCSPRLCYISESRRVKAE
jgi:hypothetical protein